MAKKKRRVNKQSTDSGGGNANNAGANSQRTSRRTQRQEQLAKEQRSKTLRTWIPLGVLGIALIVFILFRAFQPDIEGVIDYGSLARDHDTSATFPDESLPPVGGVHYPTWQKCGIYDQELDKAFAVHTLEHGGVWIAYKPSLPESDIEVLREIARDDISWTLVSPYPNLEADVVVSAWSKQLVPDGVNDERIAAFVKRYIGQGPEAGANCATGQGDPIS